MTELPSPAPGPPTKVLAVVKDLFFVARIRETARLAGVPLSFTRTPEDLAKALAEGPVSLVLIDLTTSPLDYSALFAALDAAGPRPAVLGYTTHVLAGVTKPWHGRCDRVVTKETLTAELGDILKGALPAGS